MVKKKLTKEEIEVRKKLAQSLYTKDGVITQKELAERVGVTEKTIGKWIIEGKWESERTSILLTREQELRRTYRQYTALNDSIEKRGEGANFPTPKEADILIKIAAAIGKLETEVSAQEAVEVLMSVVNFARTENLAEAKIVMKWADLFIKTKLK
jgi:transcriptional regulator with XRE-family HTH domain